MPRPKRKRQARLTFSPLPSSSPAAFSYPIQIRERAAAVRYDNHGRSAKKRRLDGLPSGQARDALSSSPVIHINPKIIIESPSKGASLPKQSSIFSQADLPTPAPSSQLEGMGKLVPEDNRLYRVVHSSYDEDERSVPIGFESPRPRYRIGHCRRLNRVDSHVLGKPRTKTGLKGASGIITTHNANSDSETPSHSSSDEVWQTPPPIQQDFGSHRPNSRVDVQRGSEFQIELSLPVRHQSIHSAAKFPTPAATSSASQSSNNLPDISPSLPLRKHHQQGGGTIMANYHGTDNASTDSAEIITPARRKRRAALSVPDMSEGSDNIRGPTPRTRKRIKNRKSEIIAISDEQEPSEDIVTPIVHRRRLRRGSMTAQERNSDITPARRQHPATSEPLSEDSDDVRGPTPRGKRSKSQKSNIISISEESESSEAVMTSSVRKGRLGRAPVTVEERNSENDDESMQDIREDVEELKETEVRNTRTRGSQRTPKKTKAQEILESLRRRRAGQNGDGEIQDATQTPSRSKRALYDTTSEDESSSSQASENEEMDDLPIRRGENLDVYEAEFVTPDEDDTIGAPHGLTDMPFEFTRHAHKKQRDHFNDVVEWMVHNKLNPAFARDDPRFQVAFRKLDDEVQGLAGSKFISAAWNAEFRETLKERPELATAEVGIGSPLQHCVACNKTNHPASFQLIFSGKAYDRHTLDDLSDSESDHDGEEPDNKTFYVGRTCCLNAETAHMLHHWRHALNQYVLGALQDAGHITPGKIVERDRWSTRRKGDYADEVVDDMAKNGETRQLYQEFKRSLESARDARPDRYSYGKKKGRR